jgi:ABC-type transport system involved in multi-copper enzyme maturation permease subunit
LKVYAIAMNTFREAVRDRVLYGIVLASIGVLLFSLVLGQLALNEEQRVVYDIGMASISLFSVVLAVFLGSSLLYKEIERKTLYVILPKPIKRSEFLLGKFVGIVLTGGVFVAIAGSVLLLVGVSQAEGMSLWVGLAWVVLAASIGLGYALGLDRSRFVAIWSVVALASTAWLYALADLEVLVAITQLGLYVLEIMLLASIALVFSSFSTPFLTGLMTSGVWLVGRTVDSMAMMRVEVIGEPTKALLDLVARVVPNFNLFVPGRSTLLEHSEAYGGLLSYVGATFGYSVLYASLMLLCSTAIFRRRDFL